MSFLTVPIIINMHKIVHLKGTSRWTKLAITDHIGLPYVFVCSVNLLMQCETSTY
jgi:hypothetical protein